jgi:hypothetical protein
MTDDGTRAFPIIHALDGRPSDDGTALLVEATAFDGACFVSPFRSTT